MARESKDVWAKRVERWRDSGLSATEFAAEIGVNENSLRHWGWRMKAERRERESKPAPKVEALAFVEIAGPPREPEPPPPSSAPAIELVLASGLVVRVPARFEAEALRRLLAVVG